MRKLNSVVGSVLTAGLLSACTVTVGFSPGAASAPAASDTVAAGQTGSRSQVPWNLVGPGWVLAQYEGAGTAPHDTATTIYLIDPAGGRYQLYQFPPGTSSMLVDWSAATRQALFRYPTTQINLVTGTVIATSDLGGLNPMYGQPNGLDIVGAAQNRLFQIDLTGQKVKVLAYHTSAARPVYAPGNATLAAGSNVGLALVRTSGGVIHWLPVPGASPGSCSPVRWWSATIILAACASGTGGSRLWLVPADGRRPTPLTPQGGTGRGPVAGWRLPSGLYLQVVNSAGFNVIARQSGGGTLTPVPVPGTGDDIVLTTLGSRLLIEAADLGTVPGGLTGITGGGSLLWFDPATGAEQWLVKAPAQQNGVLVAVPFPDLPDVYSPGL